MRASVASVLLFSIALAGASSARAFERSKADHDESIGLFWRYRTVLVRPAPETSTDLSGDAVRAAITRSIATWNVAADGCSDFRIVDDGPPTGFATNLDGGEHDGQNRIVWRETTWPEELPTGTLALTTTVYRRASGQLLDADVDFNGVHHTWTSTDDPLATRIDVENTLTHELGHLLGLAHVPDEDATMYAESGVGDLLKRSLSDDDVAGLCFIYPDGVLTPDAPILPGQPLTSGCAVARAPVASAPWLFLGLVALILRRTRAAHRGARRGGRASASSGDAGRPAAPIRAPRRWRPRG